MNFLKYNKRNKCLKTNYFSNIMMKWTIEGC